MLLLSRSEIFLLLEIFLTFSLQSSSFSINTNVRKMSWPFDKFDAPPLLDGSLAGDAGFDPLGIAKDKVLLNFQTYSWMQANLDIISMSYDSFNSMKLLTLKETLFLLREGEIKHARIAMLAALGWPVSELYHYSLSSFFGNEYVKLGIDDKVPSVLNGGLDNEFALFSLGTFFAVGAALELELQRRRREVPEYLKNFFEFWNEDGWDTPGNYGWDPLKLGDLLCGNDNKKKLFIQSIEIFNGRMSMLATVGYTVQETLTGLPVIKETPQFFHPFTSS